MIVEYTANTFESWLQTLGANLIFDHLFNIISIVYHKGILLNQVFFKLYCNNIQHILLGILSRSHIVSLSLQTSAKNNLDLKYMVRQISQLQI